MKIWLNNGNMTTIGIVIVAFFFLSLPLVFFMIPRWQKAKVVFTQENSPVPGVPEKVVSVQKVDGGNMEKTTLDTGIYFVSVNGVWKDTPKVVGNVITGEFIAESDPQRHLIPIEIVPMEDLISVGVFDGSFSGSPMVKRASLSEAQSLIANSSKVQLRFRFVPNQEMPKEERGEKNLLDAFLQGAWNIAPGVTFTPTGIGVIQ